MVIILVGSNLQCSGTIIDVYRYSQDIALKDLKLVLMMCMGSC